MLALALAAATPPVNAQQVLEEVVVSARKRGNESMENIGGSIQAIGGDELADRQVIGFSDYMRLVPGLSSNNSGAGQVQLSMRGITTTRLNHVNPNVPDTVGLYFDETPVTTSGFSPDAGLFDIDRRQPLQLSMGRPLNIGMGFRFSM